jgi:hypothetical protein
MIGAGRAGLFHPRDFGLLCGLLVVAMLSACSVGTDRFVRDVSEEQRLPLLTEAALIEPQSGDGRIYLVSAGETGQQRQLRSVQRDLRTTPDPLLPEILLLLLLSGPSQSELDVRMVTAIPAGTELISTRRSGSTLFVDITDQITELTGEALTLAVAQVVFTASELPGVRAVRLRINGEDQAWPRGDGQSRIGDLRVFDYPGFAESSQPAYPAIPST